MKKQVEMTEAARWDAKLKELFKKQEELQKKLYQAASAGMSEGLVDQVREALDRNTDDLMFYQALYDNAKTSEKGDDNGTSMIIGE